PSVFPLQVVLLLLTLIFALVHSGMASLRETGEKIIGERAYRVLFAGISLPLALSTIVSILYIVFSFFFC
uniref:NnrU domain-containing protein n=1 Tax=Aegilops tauschii subsp. strangulata TaxID=200361 RepID=A0A453JLF6_AEGTS